LKRGHNIKYRPYAFTEHGAIMAATVLNSSKAVEMSVFVVRAFVKMREQLLATATLAKRVAEVETLLLTHDSALRDLYQKIRPLLLPPLEPAKTKIGFGVREASARYSRKTRSKKKPMGVFPTLTYSPPGRRTAREMAEVTTPSCRATSANESPSVVTSSVASRRDQMSGETNPRGNGQDEFC